MRRRLPLLRYFRRGLCTRTREHEPGLFGVSGFTTPASFDVIGKEAVRRCETIVEHVTSLPRPPNAILLLDELSSALCGVVDAAELCRNVHPDPAYVEAANDVIMELSSYMQTLNTNKDMYKARKRRLSCESLAVAKGQNT